MPARAPPEHDLDDGLRDSAGRLPEWVALVGGAEKQLDLATAAVYGIDVTVWYSTSSTWPSTQERRCMCPIATGVIDLVRDRMELTGARWRQVGAEAVLKHRALRASRNLDAYWRFHKAREHQRGHTPSDMPIG